jgi:pSer/pThr/pTyr-binding forkhead associated (FHA) protein
VPSPKVSRRHARLSAKGEHLVIEDLQSANGTYVGGRRLSPGQPTELAEGTTVTLADVSLKLSKQT